MSSATACYREYAPSPPLKRSVRAIFTFAVGWEVGGGSLRRSEPHYTCGITCRHGDSFWSNLFADAHASIVCCVGDAYSIEGLWYPSRPIPHIIGPMSRSHRTTPGASFTQVGAYFTASGVRDFLRLPVHELTDKVVALEDLWRAEAIRLEERLAELANDSERVAALEAALLGRLRSRRKHRIGFDLGQLTACAQDRAGRLSVAAMADLAGVSRQYLSQIFQDQVGVNPKLFLRLTRFRALVAASSIGSQHWADLAIRSGYADQSHMIADFRKFSGSTPAKLARSNTFHPFRWSPSEAQKTSTQPFVQELSRYPRSVYRSAL
jgi:AraC-like DNA-binding protein